jgi:alpha-L-fucosidase 2
MLLLSLLLVLLSSLSTASESPGKENNQVSRYDVVWDSPSKDYNGSMPLGNGDIAVNAWVDESGDLLFYIGKTDSWDDNARLLKIGRVRISLEPRAPAPLLSFRQTLDLHSATLQALYGEGADAIELRLWVDANHPVIHVELQSRKPVRAVASIEPWRTAPLSLQPVDASDVTYGQKTSSGEQEPIVVEPDSILVHQSGRIGWFHYNVKSVGPGFTAAMQGVLEYQRPDALLHRTFGAIVTTKNGEVVNDRCLRSSSSTHHAIDVYVHTGHPATPQSWLNAVDSVMRQTEAIEPAQLREDHERWWHDFWDRSWIHVTSNTPHDSTGVSDAYTVSRAYALQRFINACAGRGRYPIKFNGSLFTVPSPGKPGDADYRQWGPGYWWQNTRLPYISMPASGDYDLMEPLFRMYGTELMPFFRYRTRHYLNHEGAYIPECIYFWGDVFSNTYGWTPFEQRTDKLQESGWHKWEWVSGLELVWMMLDRYEYTLDGGFLRDLVLPSAHEVLTFFDQHYPTDGSGRLIMYPAQAAETWWDCTNPMPELAGLHALVKRLLGLPLETTTPEQRAFWSSLRNKLPDLPTRTVDGKTMLAPAARFEKKMNSETPELYAVFPFRLVAFDTPTKDLGIEAFRHRQDGGNFGWRQDDVFAAYLGLTDTARTYIVGRAKNKHTGSRFPAFWGPNYDWIPDQDHGGILLKALQAMILQTDGKRMHLLPAWPKEWNVEFKLHAPYNTTVQGRYVDGQFKDLVVTPPERSGDITIRGNR